MSDDLGDRVNKFQLLQLPGQPIMMHMGTLYLVTDLWTEIGRLRANVAREHQTCRAAIVEARQGEGAAMTDIVERLRSYGSEDGEIAAYEIERLVWSLEQIRQVCADNAGEASNHKMALDFVHQIAIRALKEQT